MAALLVITIETLIFLDSLRQVRRLGVVLLGVYHELLNMFRSTFRIYASVFNTVNYGIRYPTKKSLLLGRNGLQAPSLYGFCTYSGIVA